MLIMLMQPHPFVKVDDVSAQFELYNFRLNFLKFPEIGERENLGRKWSRKFTLKHQEFEITWAEM